MYQLNGTHARYLELTTASDSFSSIKLNERYMMKISLYKRQKYNK